MMATDRQGNRQLEESISRWLEESAPGRLPDRVLEATFARTSTSRQHAGWRERLGRLRFAPAVPAFGGAAVVVVIAGVLALNLFSASPPRVGGPAATADPRIPFIGTWFTTDGDGSTPTMVIRASGETALEIVATDGLASVCSGGPSTMSGTGRLEAAGRFVIPAPAYTCDDGSEPRALSGPPLEEQLRNLTFIHHRGADTLTDNFHAVWGRKGAEAPGPTPTTPAFLWPQTNLEEARTAQERADAGDPAYTWQVDLELAAGGLGWTPAWESDGGAEILARFLRETLGWEAFVTLRWEQFEGTRRGSVIRCAPGRTNPLYPGDPRGGGCAPTIDELRYEQVDIDLYQPIRQDPTGIWVVSRQEILEPFAQAVPPSDAGVTSLVEAFIKARIAGQGAEIFVSVDEMVSPSQELPLLYATSGGSRYERGEFEVVDPPTWPSGWMRLRVRLFAEGGATVVEQQFTLEPSVEAGRVSLHHTYQWDSAPTTENGKPVTVQYSFVPDDVTFRAGWPWVREAGDQQTPRRIILATYHDAPALYTASLVVEADPRPIERGCEEGPAPADAAALARAIQADPDLEATAPVTVTIGGRPALQMDVDQAPGASLCENWGQAMAVTASPVGEESRTRLWLLDIPGTYVETLAIALTAPKADFERVMEAEAPMLASFEFHAP